MPPKKARVRLSSLGETPAKVAAEVVAPVVAEVVAPVVVAPVVAPVVAEVAAAAAPVAAAVAPVACCEAKNDTERAYLSSLSAIERNVCRIAEDHLQTSFDLSRSSGYISWSMKK
jgi:hypothetical protein